MSPLVEGIERAIFGEVTAEAIMGWLDQYLQRRLALGVQRVLFRTGRLAAVYGLELTNGLEVVTKVHRATDLVRMNAAVTCQRLLAEAHYPCPLPLDGPVEIEGRVVVLEARLECGVHGDAHDHATRRAMALALARQITLLRAIPPQRSGLLQPPAWAAYDQGPWPSPHDPLFDFTSTPAEFVWLDRIAKLATERLTPRRPPDTIAHSDWVCQNLRFNEGGVSAAYDWDSLLAESEAVLVGLAAGAYTEGSRAGAGAPTPDEVVAFLADYDATRQTPFSRSDQAAATAAATWVLAYNARCGLSLEALGFPASEGSPLNRLGQYRTAYLTLRW